MPHVISHFIRIGVAAFVLASFAGLSTRAAADTIDLTLGNGSTAVNFNPNGGSAQTVYGGPFHWTQTSPVNNHYPTSIITYCIDLGHAVSSGTYTTSANLTVAPTIGTSDPGKTAALDALFNKYYTISLQNSSNSAAFQLAIWDIIYDGSTHLGLNTGYIQALGATSNPLAESMLTGTLPSSYSDLAHAHLEVLYDPCPTKVDQAQIMVVPNGVPAPPALMLAGIGVLGLLGRIRCSVRTAV